jgi:hypothetical protein
MKLIKRSNIIYIILLCLFVGSCSSDPCDDERNIDCSTQDYDGDGVLNGDDESPKNACKPNFPNFNVLVIGTWSYSFGGFASGQVQINADGTYEDINNELVSNGNVISKVWRVEGTNIFTESLITEVENDQGYKARITLKYTKLECDKMVFDGQGFGDITFNRVN